MEYLLKQLYVLCVLVSQVLLITQAYEGCSVRYGRRGCGHRMLNGVLVVCDGQSAEENVPQNLPVDTVYLSLTNFKLDTLSKADFEKFKKVECLSIVDSGVNSIEKDAFSGMDSLLELSLQNAKIRSESLLFVTDENFKAILLTVTGAKHVHRINFAATKNLLNLKTLNLKGNSIKEFKRDIFAELKNLESLDLSDNKLTHLDWSWLNEMTKLNQLYLSGNQFQTIPQSMYGVFFAVKELTLADNRFHCNCKLRWLKEFYTLSADKKLDVADIECASPEVKKMEDLTLSDFICSKPSTPEVRFVQLDHRYEINCTSYGDPAPQLTLTLPDGRKVITPPPDDLSKNKPITPQIVSVAGPIQCEAANSEGYGERTEGLPEALAQSSSTILAAAKWTTSMILVSTVVIVKLMS